MAEQFVEKDPDEASPFHVDFLRVANGTLESSILSNFFIYSLTVTSFRKFLVTKFYKILSMCLNKSPSKGT